MTFTVIIEVDVIPEKKETLVENLSDFLPETREYPGFISISIHSECNSSQVVFYEQWQALSDYESYLKLQTDTGAMAILSESFRSPPSIRYFTTEDI